MEEEVFGEEKKIMCYALKCPPLPQIKPRDKVVAVKRTGHPWEGSAGELSLRQAVTVTFMCVSWSGAFTKDLASCGFWFPKPRKKGFLFKLPLLVRDTASPWSAVHTGAPTLLTCLDLGWS